MPVVAFEKTKNKWRRLLCTKHVVASPRTTYRMRNLFYQGNPSHPGKTRDWSCKTTHESKFIRGILRKVRVLITFFFGVLMLHHATVDYFKGAFDWPYSGIRINGRASKFFFGVKCRTISRQNFVAKRCCKSYVYSVNIKILVNVIFRRKPSHSYSGISPIERYSPFEQLGVLFPSMHMNFFVLITLILWILILMHIWSHTQIRYHIV